MRGSHRLVRSIAYPGRTIGSPRRALLASLLSGLLASLFIAGCMRSGEQVAGGDPADGRTPPAIALSVPANFTEATVVSGLSAPTAMAFAPDGRLFVCQQGGQLRVIKAGALLATPFLTVTVNSSGERGLLGVAFDPDFAATRHVYVYYTATSPNLHNRLSRFTASTSNPDVAESGSETILLELDPLSSATNHNGGALHFGTDGKLYIAVGENADAGNSQNMNNLLGKMLRINRDGTIPTDNPFYGTASGKNRAIWALGLRNPFTFAVQPGTGRIFINDVGETRWEEINEGRAGANYGWPTTEGATSDPRFQTPFHVYGHADGCSIAGGAFYNPATAQFPAEYVGDYFFADYCGNWIRRIDLATKTVTGFASGLNSPVDLDVGPEGALYYVIRAGGVVRKILWNGSQAPAITSHPTSLTVTAGGSATFTVSASGAAPLAYRWQRNGADISGATSPTYSLSPAQAADNGARFRAVVTNASGSAVSNEAVLTVTSNRAPTAVIATPAAGSLFSGGETIAYSGSGSDPEDGALPASAFTWQVDLHHDTHSHPFVPPTSGAASGTFTIPTRGETSPNIWYRIYLTVRDAGGFTHQVYRDIQPRRSTLTLASSPSGLQLRLDGQPVTTPYSFTGVVGIIRTLEAVTPQDLGGRTWRFVSWSDGVGTAVRENPMPASDATLSVSYQETAAGTGTVYQAENGVLYSAVVASNHAGYTGTGYVEYLRSSDSYVEWTVNVPAARTYVLEFRYALLSGSRPLAVSVNGSWRISRLPFPATGSWSTWSVTSFSTALPAGTSRIRAIAIGASGANMDCLTVK